MKSNIKYSLLLLLGAFIWGVAFVAQSAGMDYLGPFSFNGVRNFMGSIVLLPLIFIRDKKEGVETPWSDKKLWIGGIVCGVFLFLASSTQQIGLIDTAAGKAGFITALYIVLVPVFSLFLKKKPAKTVWVSVALGVVGLYFLCIDGSVSIQAGDIWLFACAFLFAFQILACAKFAPDKDPLKLSCIQFFVVGVLSIIPMIMEKPAMSNFIDCAIPILYAGIFSSGVAYTLQMVGQRHIKPSIASLLMSFESVFSVLAGFVILHETLTVRELIGCVAMFAAVIIAQIVPSKEEK